MLFLFALLGVTTTLLTSGTWMAGKAAGRTISAIKKIKKNNSPNVIGLVEKRIVALDAGHAIGSGGQAISS